jgi:hypothetical protein
VKTVLYHIPAIELLQDHEHEAEKVEDEVTTGGDAPDSEPPSPIMHEVVMAAIPESETPGRRSKHRAKMVDESSLERAERMKAARNLDFKGIKEHSQSYFLLLSKDTVLSNLDTVGISLGHDQTSIDSSLSNIRQVEMHRVSCKPNLDKLDSICDLEEKEEIENEEVDKMIIEEVMDLGSAYPKDCNTTPIFKASSTSTTRAKKRKNKKGKNLFKMKGVLWNSNRFKDPKKHKFVSDLTKENNISFIAISETGRSDFMPRTLKNLWGKIFHMA